MVREGPAVTVKNPAHVSLPDPAARRWFVLRTHARQEKAVARVFSTRGTDHYLPLIHRITTVRGRRLTSSVPLFPGYVFLFGQAEQAYEVISAKRVCQMINVPDQAQLSAELNQIRRAIAGMGRLDLYPHAVVGRRGRVSRGPFRGLEGVISQRHHSTRLILEVRLLGRGAALEIDAAMLEPAD